MSTPAEHLFVVSGMHCGGCVNSVRNALTALEGVQSVEIDLASGHVRVRVVDDQMPSHATCRTAIEDCGFSATA